MTWYIRDALLIVFSTACLLYARRRRLRREAREKKTPDDWYERRTL